MIVALSMMVGMAYVRIAAYTDSRHKITYTTTFERDVDGTPLPSISVCSEAFHNEFIMIDLMLEIDNLTEQYAEP